MTGLVLAALAAYGVHLLYSALVLRWSGFGPGPRAAPPRRPGAPTLRQRLGLQEVRLAEVGATAAVLGIVAGLAGFAVFGGLVGPLVTGAGAAVAPVAAARVRLERRREIAQESWPRMIEEIRVVTGSLGRSIPQALFDVGARTDVELRPAFAAAQREWAVSTDFARAVAVLKDRLADPTADAALETLLVAHELGGSTLDRRLSALAADRMSDVLTRKEARSRQAGVRFARRFVVIVPAGMALVGLQIGNGREAYQTPGGQLAVGVALALVGLCWWWAGRIMAIPRTRRVLAGGAPHSMGDRWAKVA